jgi:hypothetical protein
MKSPEKLKTEETPRCKICAKPATRLVDGDPSCDEHAELVYEDQVEDYTKKHQKKDEWLEVKS